MSETTYYERNRDVMLNRAKYYYENKELLRERAKNKYRELSEEAKNGRENMEETDIIICLKKKNIKDIIVRLGDIFHRCRYDD